MTKLFATVSSVLVSLVLAAWLPAQPPPPDGAPPPKAKVKAKGKGEPRKKGEHEPGAELSKAYDLLRRFASRRSKWEPAGGTAAATGPIGRPACIGPASRHSMARTRAWPRVWHRGP